MASNISNSSLPWRISRHRREHQERATDIHCPRDIGMPKTRYFGGQPPNKEVIDYSYTDNPFKLMFWDLYYFFAYAEYLPYIVNPLMPCDSGGMCELALTWGNLHCLLVHSILIVLQLAFLLIAPPMAILLPLWVTTLFVGSFFVVNQALCRILNGSPELIFSSDKGFALRDQTPFKHEKWFFHNGVAVGDHWLQNALNRLALTFGRQVTGIHNRTSGIIFDTIECLIQRNFTYATSDIRAAYKEVKKALLCANHSRVVFILHSQGGIQGGMVLDWLLQELPQDIMGKLEVYTFGNAANHFNNPYTSVQAQAKVEKRPLLESTDGLGAYGFLPTENYQETTDHGSRNNNNGHSKISPEKGEASLLSSFLHQSQPPSPPQSPLFNMKSSPHHQHHENRSHHSQHGSFTTIPESYHLQTISRSSYHDASSGMTNNDSSRPRVVSHIEHYAFSTDFVARWGVVHFATAKLKDNTIPKFVGRLFERTDPARRGGHQFVQHYLDGMFPLEEGPDGRPRCRDDNAFIDSVVHEDKQEEAEGLAGLKKVTDLSYADIVVHGPEADLQEEEAAGTKVRELSQLWRYRNGGAPPPQKENGSDGHFVFQKANETT